MNRWLMSRWLVLSVALCVCAFYLAVQFPADGGIEAFTAIASVSLAGGHFTNGIRQSRGHPTMQPPPDNTPGGEPG